MEREAASTWDLALRRSNLQAQAASPSPPITFSALSLAKYTSQSPENLVILRQAPLQDFHSPQNNVGYVLIQAHCGTV